MTVTYYIACTYFDLELVHNLNPNIPQNVWGIFFKLEDCTNYIKNVRKKKHDTLFGAWDIYLEDEERLGRTWNFRKIVKHFAPRKDHDFYGKPIDRFLVASGEI